MTEARALETNKRIISIVLAVTLLVIAMLPTGGCDAATKPLRSASIVEVALAELDYEEQYNNNSKYGRWYGMNYAYWCDMFVSWCAAQAGIPKSVFPRAASTTAHRQQFERMGIYHASAARGGTYVPQQGDAIFFYDYVENPSGNVQRHIGIVLCVENGRVFTVEGNAKTLRNDYKYYEEVVPVREDTWEREGADYVCVKWYPLTDGSIHGYAAIRYGDRTPLAHNGYVDLGKYASNAKAFSVLHKTGIMPETSSYTYSPRYGMTRGEFVKAVMSLYELSGYTPDTKPFADVPADSPYYEAVMTARSAGIVDGSGNNLFQPNIYISGTACQAIISRTLKYLGMPDKTFSFSQGDLSYILTPYTIRNDIAVALYALYQDLDTPTMSGSKLTLDGEPLPWEMDAIGGTNYVALSSLAETFEDKLPVELTRNATVQTDTTSAPIDSITAPSGETTTTLDATIASGGLGITRGTTRVYREQMLVHTRDTDAEINISLYQKGNETYIKLRSAADMLGLDVCWNGATGTVELTQRI